MVSSARYLRKPPEIAAASDLPRPPAAAFPSPVSDARHRSQANQSGSQVSCPTCFLSIILFEEGVRCRLALLI